MPHCVLAGILQMLPEHVKITIVKDFFTPQYFPHKTAKRIFYMVKNFSSHRKITPLFSPESELFLKKSESTLLDAKIEKKAKKNRPNASPTPPFYQEVVRRKTRVRRRAPLVPARLRLRRKAETPLKIKKIDKNEEKRQMSPLGGYSFIKNPL